MMKLKMCVSVVSFLGLTACYRVTTRTGLPPSADVRASRADMFIGGLVGTDESAPCPPAIVETQQTPVDWLIAAFTFGLWTPYTLTVTCAAVPMPMPMPGPGPGPVAAQ